MARNINNCGRLKFMSEDYENIDHEDLSRNISSMNTDFKPPGFANMMSANMPKMDELFGSISSAVDNQMKTTRLMGSIDGGKFSIEITNEFTCKMAIDILTELMKKFNE
jgi:hypothetical protein